MNYIKYISKELSIIELGGQAATQQMIDDGWFEYHGEIPPNSTNIFNLIDGVLTPYIRTMSNSELVEKYKKYLSDTDYKMLPNYVPNAGEDLDAIIAKRNEARDFIRNNYEKASYAEPGSFGTGSPSPTLLNL